MLNLTTNTVTKFDQKLKKEPLSLPPIDQHRPRIQSSQITQNSVNKKKPNTMAQTTEPLVKKETKQEKAERIKAQSRKEAKQTKANETKQAVSEGMKLIKQDKYADVFDKEPHKAGRVFKSGNSPL